MQHQSSGRPQRGVVPPQNTSALSWKYQPANLLCTFMVQPPPPPLTGANQNLWSTLHTCTAPGSDNVAPDACSRGACAAGKAADANFHGADKVLQWETGRLCQGQMGGGHAVHIFSHFLGRSLDVVFKRKHFNMTLHLNWHVVL